MNKINLEIINREFIYEKNSVTKVCHASTVLTLDNGEVLAAWFGGTAELDDDVVIYMARRTKNGWQPPAVIAKTDQRTHWNPVLFKTKDNRIVLQFKAGDQIVTWKTYTRESIDNGHTWSDIKELVPNDTNNGRGSVKNKPIYVGDKLLAPCSWQDETIRDAVVDISYDDGRTWKFSKVPLDHSKLESFGVVQPTLWQSSENDVHMLLRSTECKLYRSDSSDGGLTWNEAYATDIPNNNSGVDLTKLDDGTLVLCYNPVGENKGARTPLCLSFSNDNGKTWHSDYTIVDIEGEYSYPAIVNVGNRIYLTYTYNRDTVEYLVCKIHFS